MLLQSEFIQQENPELSLIQIRNVLQSNKKFELKIKIEMPLCGICNKVLSEEEKKYHNPYAYHRTCSDHREFELMYQRINSIKPLPMPYEFDLLY